MKCILTTKCAFSLFLGCMLASPVWAGGVSGAIFTTTFDGSVVNGNQYDSKCRVYLDGGPGPNAPAGAAGLPDGDYYFQVTDPSGSQLLSTDPVSNRRFQVANGVIVAHTGSHPIGIDQDHGGITISLADTSCPVDYLGSPNNGGVYKVWATPLEDFAGDAALIDNDCGNGCFHGFVPSKSKTDNFKVKATTPTFCLTIKKEFEDPSSPTGFAPYLLGWKMTVSDQDLMTSNDYHTDAIGGEVRVCGLTAGTYMVREEQKEGTHVVGLIVNGDAKEDPDYVHGFTWYATKPEPIIVFQNAEDVVIGIQ